MKYTTIFTALAATALAAPSRDFIARSHRRSHGPQSLPNIQGSFSGFPSEVAGPSSSIIPEVAAATGNSTKPNNATISISTSTSTSTHASTTSNPPDHIVYNSNWAGAVVKGGNTYTGVYGEFTVPHPKKPTAAEPSAETWSFSAWVGIDGFNPRLKCDGLWQAGVDVRVFSSGEVFYNAWYEWFPERTKVIDMVVNAGDIISVNLTRHSPTSGSVTLGNLSSGKSFTTTATSNFKLCGASADWIIENLFPDSATIGLSDFGNVTFRDTVAYTTRGTEGPGKALVMEMEDARGKVLTKSVPGKNEVVVIYGKGV
ncbi:Concanavalin A-like lectin glucanases superfamily protein [Rutstroemia sp. NJR-2017a BBW]|nr:Concanavalin A-like lectin glucanases superfamily protein [Rutstroemia sp. NJR-2017a BBW]